VSLVLRGDESEYASNDGDPDRDHRRIIGHWSLGTLYPKLAENSTPAQWVGAIHESCHPRWRAGNAIGGKDLNPAEADGRDRPTANSLAYRAERYMFLLIDSVSVM
jgi:hypothetical protein